MGRKCRDSEADGEYPDLCDWRSSGQRSMHHLGNAVIHLLCPMAIVPKQAHPAADYRTHCISSGWLLQGHSYELRVGREYETTRWNLQPNLNYSWTLRGSPPPLLKPLGANAHLRPSRHRITDQGTSFSGDDFGAGLRNGTSSALHIKVTQPCGETYIYTSS